jgi:hypothetical protein
VLPKATVTATNIDTRVRQTVQTDDKGFYAFPSLPVGHYDFEVQGAAFRPYRRAGIVIDANSRLTVDAVLKVGSKGDVVTVTENQLHVETTSTQIGEIITDEVSPTCSPCSPASLPSPPSPPTPCRMWGRACFLPPAI